MFRFVPTAHAWSYPSVPVHPRCRWLRWFARDREAGNADKSGPAGFGGLSPFTSENAALHLLFAAVGTQQSGFNHMLDVVSVP
jgi:hypothetical protein